MELTRSDFTRSKMLYKDYVWRKHRAFSVPRVIKRNDNSELNRTAGQEVLFFILCLQRTWGWTNPDLRSYKMIERTIREELPPTIKTYAKIKDWIFERYAL